MQAGRLRNRVTLQRQTSGQDEIGQPITTWSDVDSIWADIRHVSGIETVKSGAIASIVKVSVRIRYRSDVDSGMRILGGATAYNISAILPDTSKKQYLDLVCEVVS